MGLLLGLGVLSPGEAKACGGGMVSEVDADVAVGAQRVFVSVRKDGTTDIVTQLAVSGTADFGVLIPLPSAPTLDQTPIDTRELDALDAATQVHFFSREEASDSQGSGSSGCGSSDAGDGELAGLGGRNDEGGGVTASEFLDVGPVTAVILTADDGAALTAWLDENGFAVGTNDQSVVDAYVGQGRHFLAFKRAEGAPKTDTSVGVHFSLAGDQRGYPLRMARLGASSEIAITTFVASEYGAAPTAPFASLTLDDLEAVRGETPEAIAESYKQAIRNAVRDRSGKAFVIEGVYPADQALEAAPKLDALTEPGFRVTRLTSIMDSSTLDTDVAFTAPPPETVPTEHELGVAGPSSPQGTKQAFMIFGLLLPALLGLSRRRLR